MSTIRAHAIALTLATIAALPAAAWSDPKREAWWNTRPEGDEKTEKLQQAGSYADAAAAMHAYATAWRPKLAETAPIECRELGGMEQTQENCREALGKNIDVAVERAARYEALDAAQRLLTTDPKGAARPFLKLLLAEQAGIQTSRPERQRIFAHLIANDAAVGAFVNKHFPAALDVEVDPRFEEVGRLAITTQFDRSSDAFGLKLRSEKGKTKGRFLVRSTSSVKDNAGSVLGGTKMQSYAISTAVELVDPKGKRVLQLGQTSALLGISWSNAASASTRHVENVLDAVLTELLVRVDRGDL